MPRISQAEPVISQASGSSRSATFIGRTSATHDTRSISIKGMAVPSANAHRHPVRPTVWQRRLLGALLVAACLNPLLAHARTSKAREPALPPGDMPASQLSIALKNDRLTLAVAKATQVYLYGVIDADAPQRFDAWLKAGKIPPGSDVYLDASGEDMGAGFALGRLFRSSSLVTHVGTLRRPGEPPKAALCTDACAYAYLGGLYRWSASGMDRIGVHQSHVPAIRKAEAGRNQAADEAAAYLKSMDANPWAFYRAPTPARTDMVWFDSEQLLGWGLANNGRLPLNASYQRGTVPAILTFSQTVRDGDNKVTLTCDPEGVTLTAYYTVGRERARQLVGRESRSYFEINEQEITPQQNGRARAVNEAIVFSRTLSMEQVASLLSTYSMGAWLKDKSGVVRYGFTMGPARIKDSYANYYGDCQKIVQRSGAHP